MNRKGKKLVVMVVLLVIGYWRFLGIPFSYFNFRELPVLRASSRRRPQGVARQVQLRGRHRGDLLHSALPLPPRCHIHRPQGTRREDRRVPRARVPGAAKVRKKETFFKGNGINFYIFYSPKGARPKTTPACAPAATTTPSAWTSPFPLPPAPAPLTSTRLGTSPASTARSRERTTWWGGSSTQTSLSLGPNPWREGQSSFITRQSQLGKKLSN